MKRILILMLIAILTLSLTAMGIGCKVEAAEEEAVEEEVVEEEAVEEEAVEVEEVQEPVTIRVWKGIHVEDEGWVNFPEWLGDFEEKYPWVTIEWTGVAWADMRTLMNTAFAAGEPPDVFYSFTGGYVDEVMQFCHDFKEIYTEEEYAEITKGLTDEMLADFVVDGKQVGIPFFGGPNFFVWNKDMFERAGLDPDTPPDTWEELITFAKALTIDTDGDGKIDQWGFGQRSYESGAAKPEQFLWQAGFNLLNDDRTDIGYDDEGAIAAFEMVEKLWQIEKVAVPLGLYPGDTIQNAFFEERFAMWMHGTGVFRQMEKDGIELNIDGGPFPAGPGTHFAGGRGAPAGWGCWSIAEDTKHLELVKEFVYDFLSDPVKIGLSANRMMAVPASSEAVFNADTIALIRSFENAKYGVGYPYGLVINEVLEAINNAFQAVQLGQLDARSAWEQAVEEGRRAFQ